MKTRFYVLTLTSLIWILALSACGAETPSPPAPTESLPAPTQTEVQPTQELATAIPTLVPANLGGPQAGSSMPWMDGATLMYVPDGQFTMGNNAYNAPQWTVSLDDYWIYKTEVTNRMYALCVSVGACAAPTQELGAPRFDNPVYANYPVVGVTWDMAANYCAWAQASLPTEAQWEKAARGTTGAAYPWGSEEADCSLGNFGGCLGSTTEVTKFTGAASPYGALDMSGNVFEWVNDYYAEPYPTSQPQNPTGPDSGNLRVVRSSSFETSPTLATVAIRRPASNAYRSHDLGFRCVVEQPQPLAPMCQVSSYIPNSAIGIASCETPTVQLDRLYCDGQLPFAVASFPASADYQIRGDNYTCTTIVSQGLRQIVCSGPNSGVGAVEVCNPACGSAPDVTGAERVCEAGYTLDDTGRSCLYSPVSALTSVAGCPAGYNMIDRGGQNVCAPAPGPNGDCPAGLYFDSTYGACVSPSGADVPYGIDAPELAAQSFQGCLPGYAYDPNFQCCQPVSGGIYPGCPVGTVFDNNAQTCVPNRLLEQASGCQTLALNMMQCTEPFQINYCPTIQTEAACLKNKVYDCLWNEKIGVCEYVPPSK